MINHYEESLSEVIIKKSQYEELLQRRVIMKKRIITTKSL
jgi:hypothetical protein